MISLAVLSIVGPTYPVGLTFNDCGVANTRFLFRNDLKGARGLFYEIRLVCVNGLWGGSIYCGGTMFGYMSPIVRRDCRFTNVDDCIESQMQKICDFLKKDKLYIPKLEDFHEAKLWLHR